LIQYPRVDDSVLQLYSTSKDASRDVAIAQIFVKNFTTLPVNMDPDGYRLEKITENGTFNLIFNQIFIIFIPKIDLLMQITTQRMM